MKDNGVAGIHLVGLNNFTFEATIGDDSTEGEGNVGSLTGQQPIEIIIESTSLAKFADLRVQSTNGEILLASASLRYSICVISSSIFLVSHAEWFTPTARLQAQVKAELVSDKNFAAL